MALDLTALDAIVLPVFFQFHMLGCKIFLQRIRIGIKDEEPSAKGSGHILAEHLGITSCDIDTVFGIGQATHELIPIWDILYLVEKNYWFLAV